MVVQRTFKLVVMSRINFEDHELIKRQWVGKKMNVMGGMFKDQKKRGNHRSSLRLLLEVVRVFKVLEFTTA
jgi:hypothetical protein